MTKKILCVAVPQTTFIPAYYRRTWGINKAAVSKVQSFYQQQAQCISRSLVWGPTTQRDTSKMFCRVLPPSSLRCCAAAGNLFTFWKHRKKSWLRCHPPWNSTMKMQQGQLWKALPCVKMSSTWKALCWMQPHMLEVHHCFVWAAYFK